VGFNLTFSYHSENNSDFCRCRLNKQKECIHQKNRQLWERRECCSRPLGSPLPGERCSCTARRWSALPRVRVLVRHRARTRSAVAAGATAGSTPPNSDQPINVSFDLRGIDCLHLLFLNEVSELAQRWFPSSCRRTWRRSGRQAPVRVWREGENGTSYAKASVRTQKNNQHSVNEILYVQIL